MCRVENISEWPDSIKRALNEHINRTAKLVRDNIPAGRRNIVRPRRQWSDNIDRA